MLTVDPFMLPILERARANPAPDYSQLPIGEGRTIFERLAAYWNTSPVTGVATRDLTIPGPAGKIPARLYVPVGAADNGPVVVHAHGGGWTFGSYRTHDRSTRLLALESKLMILSVDYRLAPECPFPAGMDDLLAAIAFVETGGLAKEALGQSRPVPVPAARIAVAGDSAGANIALAAMLARVRAGLPQVGTAALFYGCYAPDFDTMSHAQCGNGSFILSSERMRWYWANYIGNRDFAVTTLAAPSRAPIEELAQLPTLYMNAAGLDCLRDDTLILSARLAEAGVGHRMDVIPGIVHGFQQMSGELPAAREAQRTAGHWLARHFAIANA